MKIDRIIGIITVLQRKGRATRASLAEKFEVSTRTISRDIEVICAAGIPIVVSPGLKGGIEIMEGFNFDSSVFTKDELAAIFAGLKALDSVSHTAVSPVLSEKLFGRENVIVPESNMLIDLSSFYKDTLSEKINLLRKAAMERKCVTFHYFYNKGEDDKLIEPVLTVFKWSNWYVFGFCPERNDYRMYKLNRLWELKITDEIFPQRVIPTEKLDFDRHIIDDYKVTAVFDESIKYRLVEEYGPWSFTVREDGKLYTEWGFTDVKNALDWYLGFGDKVEILAPDDFRKSYIEALKKMLKKYEKCE